MRGLLLEETDESGVNRRIGTLELAGSYTVAMRYCLRSDCDGNVDGQIDRRYTAWNELEKALSASWKHYGEEVDSTGSSAWDGVGKNQTRKASRTSQTSLLGQDFPNEDTQDPVNALHALDQVLNSDIFAKPDPVTIKLV